MKLTRYEICVLGEADQLSCQKMGTETDRNYKTNAFMKNLKMENVLLVKALDHIETYEQLGEQLLSLAENLIITKDIVKSFANKVIEIEEKKSRTIIFMDTELDDLSELCCDIKSDVIKLYDVMCNDVSSNFTQENEVYCGECRQINNNSCSYNMISVKEELELVKKECSQMTSDSKEIEKSAVKGKYVIESLKREINKLKEGSLEKDVVINDLQSAVSKGQSKLKAQEEEINICLSKINTVVGAEKAYVEDKVGTLSEKISSPNNIMSTFNTDVPIDTSNVSKFMRCVSQEFKQSFKNKGLVMDLTESETFFSSQCSILISYVKDLEIKLLSTQYNNANLSEEINILKENLKKTTNHIEEADQFLNRIISNIPFKISSIHDALEAAEYIFSEYKTLKEIDRTSCDDQKANQYKLAQQLKDMKFLDKYNSDLKLQLESYENDIRKLRSELRNMRSEWQRKARSIVKSNKQKSQTGNVFINLLL